MQTKLTSTKLNIQLQSPQLLNVGTVNQARTIAADYNKLNNLPSVNGVTLTGDITSTDLRIISENTTAGWEQNYNYIPKRGEIIIYTDHDRYVDDKGNTIVSPDIKIGDGQVPVIDLPFVNEAFKSRITQALESHIFNTEIHVSEQDRTRWDNKLNYTTDGEMLILNRN